MQLSLNKHAAKKIKMKSVMGAHT